ncbi:MAG: ABC transporter substrate-binding protein, partial [Dermatophilaceae bacterium]
MKFGTRNTILLSIASAVLVTTTGCSGGVLGSGDDGKASASGPIKLGMVVPISGSSAPTGAYMKNGAQLAVDEINKAGG